MRTFKRLKSFSSGEDGRNVKGRRNALSSIHETPHRDHVYDPLIRDLGPSQASVSEASTHLLSRFISYQLHTTLTAR